MKVKTLNVSVSKGRQDFVFEELAMMGSDKIRIIIRRDSYAFQSFARVEVWSAVAREWRDCVSLHYSQMRTEEKLPYVPRFVGAVDFADDRNALVKKAALVLA